MFGIPSQNSHDCKGELRMADLKATPTRIAVLRLFEQSTQPIDAPSIIKLLRKKKISADEATVFRILNTFTQNGLTKQIQLREGKFRYELASTPEHHHLICENCGSISDIAECSIQKIERSIEEKKQFKIRTHSLEFFGLCKNCN